jgi:hypothetical protein
MRELMLLDLLRRRRKRRKAPPNRNKKGKRDKGVLGVVDEDKIGVVFGLRWRRGLASADYCWILQ